MDKSLTADIAVRTINVYLSQGQNLHSLETSAVTTADLKKELSLKHNVNLDGLNLIDGDSSSVYNLNECVLPTHDITIFAMPAKQTLGGSEWPENRKYFAVIREAKKRIADELCTKKDFGGLGAKNLANIIAVLEKQDSKKSRNRKTTKTRTSKISKKIKAKAKTVQITPSLLQRCLNKFKELNVSSKTKLVKDLKEAIRQENRTSSFTSNTNISLFARKAKEISRNLKKLK